MVKVKYYLQNESKCNLLKKYNIGKFIKNNELLKFQN